MDFNNDNPDFGGPPHPVFMGGPDDLDGPPGCGGFYDGPPGRGRRGHPPGRGGPRDMGMRGPRDMDFDGPPDFMGPDDIGPPGRHFGPPRGRGGFRGRPPQDYGFPPDRNFDIGPMEPPPFKRLRRGRPF